jgi:hypothetical protein
MGKATDAEILEGEREKTDRQTDRPTPEELANGGRAGSRRPRENRGVRIKGRVPSAAAVAPSAAAVAPSAAAVTPSAAVVTPRPRHRRLGLAAAGAAVAVGAAAAVGAYRAKRQGEVDCNKRLSKKCKFSCMKRFKVGSQKRCDKCIGDNKKNCTEEEIIKFWNDKGYNKMRTGAFFDSKPDSDTRQYLPSDPVVTKYIDNQYLPTKKGGGRKKRKKTKRRLKSKRSKKSKRTRRTRRQRR